MYRRLIFYILLLFSLSNGVLLAKTGSIKGEIYDTQSKLPLAGANVQIIGTNLGAACDASGRFQVQALQPGTYRLEFSYIGYQPLIKTDIIVRPGRSTYLKVEMNPVLLESEIIQVSAAYFSETAEMPVSSVNFDREEIRRAPGSAGDVSRIIMGLPSLAKVNDQSNSLIVRGGSPTENAFFVDNIEIPNINHFPTQGASGGPIGILNVDLIEDVSFNAGGFSAGYGDRLSSVMEIKLRDGNPDEFDGQLDLNFAGFGTVLEGPLPAGSGSWMFSARRSFLDLLVKAADIGSSVAPRYGDIQGKVVLNLSPKHRLTWLTVLGDDHNSPDRDVALENDMIVYGNQDIYESTNGLNWRAIWSDKVYSNTSVSYTQTSFSEDYFETASMRQLLSNRSDESEFKIRNRNHLQLHPAHALELGVSFKALQQKYNNFFAEYTDALGNPVEAFPYETETYAHKLGGFISHTAHFERFTLTTGLRLDYFSYTEDFSVAPRVSLQYHLSSRTSLHAAAGIYYQDLPPILLIQHDSNRSLRGMRAIHYIVGAEHLLTKNTRLTAELYHKSYSNFPIDPGQPALFLIDELFYRYGFFFNHNPLTDIGKARTSGVEVIIQKKLAGDFYGLASAAYFKSEYKTGDGIWRDRVFDNRFIVSVEGGYKPNARWEYSLRWIYAGGSPYTPFDESASSDLHRAVLDESRINQARYPAYHSLNVRLDRRFHFQNSSLIFYLSIWNAYNQQNVATYFWNEKENKPDVIYQWSMLPIFGLEYEF